MANELTKIPKFRRCVLQNFPFIEQDFDALTDYQLLCKVVEYLNKVITSQNEVIEVAESLTVAFNQLQSFVENYFANLDVQEEINNKLDEMAESGQLADIVSQYLSSTAVFGYNTVADMQASSNLVNGSYAKTLGYTRPNDGGAGLYKIRTLQVSDTLDSGSLIPISSTLVAELVYTDHINYNQFGATGDGETNDFTAMYNAHVFANAHNLRVEGVPESEYYISAADREIPVYTTTDFKNAKLIIDDTATGIDHTKAIFAIRSSFTEQNITINELSTNSTSIDLTGVNISTNALVEVTNSNKKQFIRSGVNADSGQNQFDSFRVDTNGTIIDTVLWDLATITGATIKEIGDPQIEFKNVRIETIANEGDTEYEYFYRNIRCSRSNTVISNIYHTITNEDNAHSQPYDGIIYITNCCNVQVNDCQLSAHKTFYTSGSTPMGTYDIRLNRAIDISLNNTTQINSISDNTKWGIITSNYCKNISYNNCVLNRFDAHKGVNNLTIDNSIIGYQGIRVVGFGKLIIKNTKIVDSEILVTLRDDYGSFWDGDIIIENVEVECKFLSVRDGRMIVNAKNDGTHNFGYTCQYPNIYVDGITFHNAIDDTKTNFTGISVFYAYASGKGAITNSYNPVMGDTISIKNAHCDATKNGFVMFGSGIDIELNKLYCADNSLVTGRYTNDYYARKKALDITPNFHIYVDNVDIEYNTPNFCDILGYGEPTISTMFTTYNTASKRLLPEIIVRNCENICNFPQYPAIYKFYNCKIDRIVTPNSGVNSLALVEFHDCLIAPAGYVRHLESAGNEITYSYLETKKLVAPANDKTMFRNCFFEGLEEYQTGMDTPADSSLYKKTYYLFTYIGTIESAKYLRNGYDIVGCSLSDKILYSFNTDDRHWFQVFDFFNSTAFSEDLGLLVRKIGYTSSTPSAITITRPSGSETIALKEGITYVNVSTDTMSIYLNNNWVTVTTS